VFFVPFVAKNSVSALNLNPNKNHHKERIGHMKNYFLLLCSLRPLWLKQSVLFPQPQYKENRHKEHIGHKENKGYPFVFFAPFVGNKNMLFNQNQILRLHKSQPQDDISSALGIHVSA
jgi:hypothetical protein